jgi:hypothetical protein
MVVLGREMRCGYGGGGEKKAIWMCLRGRDEELLTTGHW